MLIKHSKDLNITSSSKKTYLAYRIDKSFYCPRFSTLTLFKISWAITAALLHLFELDRYPVSLECVQILPAVLLKTHSPQLKEHDAFSTQYLSLIQVLAVRV
jgi:hypothetical protein